MSKFHPQNTEKKTDPDFWYLREIQEDIKLPRRINKHQSATPITLSTKLHPEGISPLQVIYRPNTSSLIALDSTRNQRIHFFQGSTFEHIGSLRLQGNSVADIAYVNDSLFMLDKNNQCLKKIDLSHIKQKIDILHACGKSSPEIDLSDFRIQTIDIKLPAELAKALLRFYVWTNSTDIINYTMWIPNSNILLSGLENSNIIQMNSVIMRIPETINTLQIGSLTYSDLSDVLYVSDSSSGYVLELQSINKSINMVKVIAGGSLMGFHMGLAVESKLSSITGLCTYSINDGQIISLCNEISHNVDSKYWSEIIKIKHGHKPSVSQIIELLKYSQFIVAVDSIHQVAVSISLPRPKNSHDKHLVLYKVNRPAKVLPLLENIIQTNVTMAPNSSLLFWSNNCCDMTLLDSGINDYLYELYEADIINISTHDESSHQSPSKPWPRS
ncbi:MAG: hypothetical protein NTX45_28235 [Proteobacteria bacterium]|nr:hypothetical protein [Pseudomonadota bacterium]